MRSELNPKDLISHHINKLAGGQEGPAGQQAQIFSEITLAPYLDTTVLQVQTIKNKGHNR